MPCIAKLCVSDLSNYVCRHSRLHWIIIFMSSKSSKRFHTKLQQSFQSEMRHVTVIMIEWFGGNLSKLVWCSELKITMSPETENQPSQLKFNLKCIKPGDTWKTARRAISSFFTQNYFLFFASHDTPTC